MPIRPQHRWLYPIDWPQLSASIRFRRAKGRCEYCARPHGRTVLHLGDGHWWDRPVWRDDRGSIARSRVDPALGRIRSTRVFLAAAHLDHDPTNNSPRNLAALCQRCHLIHDRDDHRRRRALTFQSRKALGDLFLGPYPLPGVVNQNPSSDLWSGAASLLSPIRDPAAHRMPQAR